MPIPKWESKKTTPTEPRSPDPLSAVSLRGHTASTSVCSDAPRSYGTTLTADNEVQC